MSDAHTRPDGATMRAFLNARGTARQALADARRRSMLMAVPALAAILRAHGARRVWLFGSLVGDEADEQSDIDLAVEGLPPERFIEARVALSESAPVDFDLVRLETAPQRLRTRILSEGKELEG